jgi:hypothetical protein
MNLRIPLVCWVHRVGVQPGPAQVIRRSSAIGVLYLVAGFAAQQFVGNKTNLAGSRKAP